MKLIETNVENLEERLKSEFDYLQNKYKTSIKQLLSICMIGGQNQIIEVQERIYY